MLSILTVERQRRHTDWMGQGSVRRHVNPGGWLPVRINPEEEAGALLAGILKGPPKEQHALSYCHRPATEVMKPLFRCCGSK